VVTTLMLKRSTDHLEKKKINHWEQKKRSTKRAHKKIEKEKREYRSPYLTVNTQFKIEKQRAFRKEKSI